ncbi:MAG: hypothetical protein JW954_01770, partial [Dehalococcoidaceae bacterium]|nr:hypothetical protein [Dehalococcoidaceae bacterium]
MKIIIHRGTHEIGGSCMELASLTGNTRIAVDLGMPLVNSDKTPFEWKTYRHLTVAELTAGKILPNVSGLYNADETPISAIILSHAHLDHYGFLRFASKDIPVFMSTGAKSLAEVSNIFLDTRINFEKVNTFSMWQPFRVGEFTITPYLVDHSAPDAAAFLIEGDGQRIFYSGDFRGHGRKKVLLENIIKTPPQNIDYLVMEGSMLGREEGRFPDEDEVERGIYAILLNKKTPCYIFTSSQNLDRLVSIFRAARQSGRTLVIDLYTAFVLDKLSSISPKVPQFNWQGIRVLYSRYHANKLAGQDKQLLYKYRCSKIELEEILNQPQDKVLLVKDSRYFRILAGKISKATTACAVYSMWSGYLERSDLRQFLHDHNIEMTEVHTSGHAYIGQLKSLAAALQPRFIIPMHTFYPGKYAELFDNVIQLKDGETMDLDTSRKANLNKGRALSRVFIETLSPEKAGLYGPLVELVRKNKDLHLEFQGQLNLDNPNSDTPKDESIII